MSDLKFSTLARNGGIASITLQREPLNVLHNPMMAELNTILEKLVSDRDLVAIVFRAVGKVFSAGVDVGDHSPQAAAEMIRLFHGVFRRLASTDALTIAVVHGAALGGGCELACFCDIVLASTRAKFGQPEVQVGVFPPVAACILAEQVGMKKAVELNALGRTIDATEAHRIGLVNEVYEKESFDEDVRSYLDEIKRMSRPVVRLTKRATVEECRERFLRRLEVVEKMYLEELMQLEDSKEGVAAFLERRDPVWRHA